jgi:hypothetical protein
MNYNFITYPIEIKLDTNIQGKEQMILTRSILHFKPTNESNSVLGEYPLFIETHKYPETYLYTTSYDNRVKFFFNKSFFNKKMNQYYPNEGVKYEEKIRNNLQRGGLQRGLQRGGINNKKEIEEEKEKSKMQSKYPNIKIKNDLVEHNIKTMLSALFPITYPINNNIRTSHNMKITKHMDIDFKFQHLIPKPMQKIKFLNQVFFEKDVIPTYYSYLKVDGQIYTVTDIIWVNDLYNNKEYSELFIKYEILRNWQEIQKKILEEEIERKIDIFSNKYVENNKIFSDKELTFIKDSIKKINDTLNKLSKDVYSNRENISRYNNAIDSFEELKTEIVNINGNSDNIPQLNSSLDNIKILYDKILKNTTIDNNMKILFEKIRKMTIYVQEMFQLNYVNSNYFDKSTINFEFLDDVIISKEIKERFKKYTEFIILVQEFTKLKKRSTNELLQRSIELFLDRINEKQIIYLLQPYFLKEKDPIENFKEYLNTGVLYDSNKNMYRIEIRIDLILGEINDENHSTINCTYAGEKLTTGAINNVEIKVPFWKLPDVRMMYNVNTNDSTIKNDNKEFVLNETDNKEKEENTEEPNKPESNMKGGSYTKKKTQNTRKLKSAYIRTMKRYH